ncbi:MAG: AbrB family transcriptional regulator [Pseudomonadota bacterium]
MSSAASLRRTALSLTIGAIGAALAHLVGLPIAVLTGPAIAVSLAGLAGLRTGFDETVRNAVFLLVGVTIGSGVDPDAGQALLRWPLAFAALAVMLWLTLVLGSRLLQRLFGLDRRSAILAAAPGHLSFVVGLSTGLNLDTTRVVVVQSVRLLALTLTVPAIAALLGVDLSGPILPSGAPLSWLHLAALLVAGLALGTLAARIGLPAPLLIGGMLASSIGHGTGVTPGLPPPWIAAAGLVAVGTLIGTRFSGISRQALLRSLTAGLAVTALCVLLALAFAIPVANLLGFEVTHVLIAFAPGGLETMIAMGVVLGADPGFVAAAHVARLLILTLILPAFVGRLR